MKKIILLTVLSVLSVSCFAQFTTDGTLTIDKSIVSNDIYGNSGNGGALLFETNLYRTGSDPKPKTLYGIGVRAYSQIYNSWGKGMCVMFKWDSFNPYEDAGSYSSESMNLLGLYYSMFLMNRFGNKNILFQLQYGLATCMQFFSFDEDVFGIDSFDLSPVLNLAVTIGIGFRFYGVFAGINGDINLFDNCGGKDKLQQINFDIPSFSLRLTIGYDF